MSLTFVYYFIFSRSATIVAAALIVGLYITINDAVDRKVDECLIKRFFDQNIDEKYNISAPFSFAFERSKIKFTANDCNSIISEGHERALKVIDSLEIQIENPDSETSKKLVDCIRAKLRTEDHIDAVMFCKVLSNKAMTVKSDELKRSLMTQASRSCVTGDVQNSTVAN